MEHYSQPQEHTALSDTAVHHHDKEEEAPARTDYLNYTTDMSLIAGGLSLNKPRSGTDATTAEEDEVFTAQLNDRESISVQRSDDIDSPHTTPITTELSSHDDTVQDRITGRRAISVDSDIVAETTQSNKDTICLFNDNNNIVVNSESNQDTINDEGEPVLNADIQETIPAKARERTEESSQENNILQDSNDISEVVATEEHPSKSSKGDENDTRRRISIAEQSNSGNVHISNVTSGYNRDQDKTRICDQPVDPAAQAFSPSSSDRTSGNSTRSDTSLSLSLHQDGENLDNVSTSPNSDTVTAAIPRIPTPIMPTTTVTAAIAGSCRQQDRDSVMNYTNGNDITTQDEASQQYTIEDQEVVESNNHKQGHREGSQSSGRLSEQDQQQQEQQQQQQQHQSDHDIDSEVAMRSYDSAAQSGSRSSSTPLTINQMLNSIGEDHYLDRMTTTGSDEQTLTEAPRPRHVWESDRQASECRRCNRRFNFLVRRHHCRRCGQVFCDRCSSHRVRLPVEELVEDPMISTSHYPIIALNPRRVCDSCIRIPIKADSSSSALYAPHSSTATGNSTSVGHRPHPMNMKRTDSQQSLMTECPVCGAGLLGMRKHQQENHLNQCLNAGSPTVRPPRYIVYSLAEGATQVGDECPICFEEFETGNKIARMVCLCSYHKHCLRDWLERGKGCPIHYDSNIGTY